MTIPQVYKPYDTVHPFLAGYRTRRFWPNPEPDILGRIRNQILLTGLGARHSRTDPEPDPFLAGSGPLLTDLNDTKAHQRKLIPLKKFLIGNHGKKEPL